MKYKVGEKVRVVQCYSGGNFAVGDIVEIIQIGDDDGFDHNCYGAISQYDGMKWYLQEDEVGANTNAARIRAMSDEELAREINLMFKCDSDWQREFLNWLQQPAEKNTKD